MPDITTVWDIPNARGDWVMAGAALASGSDLVTSVLVSLFTDRLADADDVIPDGTSDPRGWWGDLGNTVPIGSRLWLLDRAKATQATLQDAQGYIEEALQWLIDDGVASAVDVQCQWTTPTMLGAQVTITQPDGTSSLMNFASVWQGIS